MHEPVATTVDATLAAAVAAIARWSGAVDTFSSAIAGFALLAGTRAFAFTSLLAWREPVLGGVGLVLLAAVGWLRWQCGGAAATREASPSRTASNHGNEAGGATPAGFVRHPRTCAERARVACYNRSSDSAAQRRPCRALLAEDLS